MGELSLSLLTAILTLFVGLIIFTLSKIIEEFYIKPYQSFKEEITRTKSLIYLYNPIFTNYFNGDQSKKEFISKVLDAQELLRKRWANLLVYHNRIKKSWLINLFCNKSIPSGKEMEKVAKGILCVIQSSLIYSKTQHPSTIINNSKERDEKIKETIAILMKY